jgi:hypothetical protein
MTPEEFALYLSILARLARILEAYQKGDDVTAEDLAFAHKMAEVAEEDALNTP